MNLTTSIVTDHERILDQDDHLNERFPEHYYSVQAPCQQAFALPVVLAVILDAPLNPTKTQCGFLFNA